MQQDGLMMAAVRHDAVQQSIDLCVFLDVGRLDSFFFEPRPGPPTSARIFNAAGAAKATPRSVSRCRRGDRSVLETRQP